MSIVIFWVLIPIYCYLLLSRPRTCAVLALVVFGGCAVDAALRGKVDDTFHAAITGAVYVGIPLLMANMDSPRRERA